MATIKIYDYATSNRSIEFLNANGNELDTMALIIIEPDISEPINFNLSKEDAQELVNYLENEFKL